MVKKRRWLKYIGIGTAACLFLCGCGNEIPQMTRQQQSMVTEYATGMVLKYTSNYHDKINRKVGDEELQISSDGELVDDASPVSQTGEESVGQTQPNADAETMTDAPVIPTTEETDAEGIEPAQLSLEEVLMLAPAFHITYDGYEICDAYSGENEEELAFEMAASPGKKLLVLKFLVSNVSGQEQVLDVFSQNAKVRVTAGGEVQSALVTMLGNDLLTVSDTMEADASGIYVVIAQIAEDSVVEDIQFSVSCQGNRAQYQF